MQALSELLKWVTALHFRHVDLEKHFGTQITDYKVAPQRGRP